MKKTLLSIACLAAVAVSMSSQTALAGVILQYDSAGNTTQLSIVGTTDSTLVSAADPTTSIDGVTQAAGYNGTQTQVQGPLGTSPDLVFRFGGSGTGSAISYAN